MKKVSSIVLRTAGTNCDLETVRALEVAGSIATRVHVEELLNKSTSLENFNLMVIPGGFSYGDDIASGRVFANELVNKLGNQLNRFLENGGLAIGICNGFQVLVKAGLLPDRTKCSNPSEQKFSLVDNDSGVYIDRWVHLRVDSSRCVFVDKDEIIELPVAHAEGKFIATENSLIDDLFANGQVVFQYVDSNGKQAEFPDNPNGSYRAVAGVCDLTGRILGLMPHPERFISPYAHPRHTREGLKEEGDGLRVFVNAINHIRSEIL